MTRWLAGLVVGLYASVAATQDDALRKDVEQLKKEVASLKGETKGSDLRLFFDKGLSMESADGQFKFKIGGRLMNDWAWISEDEETENVVGDQEDGTEFRSARISLEGTLYKDYDFKAEYDFAGGKTAYKDLWMGTAIPGAGYLKVGHQKEPMGLEMITSSRFNPFMERAAATMVFAPDRNAGLAFARTELEERMTWSLGAFRPTDDTGNGIGDGEYGVTGRIAGLPWYEEKGRRLLHLGLSASVHGSDDDVVHLRERPEIHLADRYVDTGAFAADRATTGGLEAAVVVGPWSLQGEYYWTSIDAPDGAEEPDFSGWYVGGSWFLTGEHRVYKAKGAAFDRVSPTSNFSPKGGGWGAWEVALRYSTIDLADGDIWGGELKDITAGVNWYLNPNLRIMFDYIRADLEDRGAPGDVGTTDALMARFQIDF